MRGLRLKRADVLVMAVIAIAAGIFFFFSSLKGTGQTAIVKVDGAQVLAIALGMDGSYPVHTPYGDNILQVEDGKIRMAYSECTNQVCVHIGWVEKEGAQIVCLPHRLVVTLEGGTLDAVAG